MAFTVCPSHASASAPRPEKVSRLHVQEGRAGSLPAGRGGAWHWHTLNVGALVGKCSQRPHATALAGQEEGR
jgi:hypothetical protein